MSSSIKEVFKRQLSDLELDSKLVKRLSHFKHAFINKNDDHIKFFGGNLLGVEVVRYLQADRDEWFSEVLDVDDVSLTEALYSLEVINEEYKRTSDVVNLTSSIQRVMNQRRTIENLQASLTTCFVGLTIRTGNIRLITNG